MDHSHGGGHSSMPMDDDACSMAMLWNSQIRNTCVVFPQWHIRTPLDMFLSCLLIAGICVGYAWLLRYIRVMDRVLVVADSGGEGLLGGRETPPLGSGEDGYLALPSHEHQHGRLSLPNFSPTGTNPGERQLRTPSPSGSFFPPSSAGGPRRMEPQLAVMSRKTRTIRAGLYAVTVGISFFLMLVAMTYNTYLFGAILAGSFVGHWMFEPAPALSGGGSVHGKGLACH